MSFRHHKCRIILYSTLDSQSPCLLTRLPKRRRISLPLQLYSLTHSLSLRPKHSACSISHPHVLYSYLPTHPPKPWKRTAIPCCLPSAIQSSHVEKEKNQLSIDLARAPLNLNSRWISTLHDWIGMRTKGRSKYAMDASSAK